MNSFETDLKRAIFSFPFLIGVGLEILILWQAGPTSEVFQVAVPVLATFPYTTAWIQDYESGFLKYYIVRTGIGAYIMGKILVCAMSGGLVEGLGYLIYANIKGNEVEEVNLQLLFVAGMLWAIVATTLAAWAKSRYVAYGGAFVVCYLLIILHERYFEKIYVLYPKEWIFPKHTWVFGTQGIIAMMVGIGLIFLCIYQFLLRRYIARV